MARTTRGKKKINAVAMTKVQQPRLPIETDKNKDFRGGWVPFFKDDNNTFPNDCAKRAKRSSTHNALIESKVGYIVGKGFTYHRNGETIDIEKEKGFKDYISSINNHNESLIDIYTKLARDLVTTGNFALEVVRRGSSQFLFHKDITTVRLQKADQDGKINNAYISADWSSIKKKTMAGTEEKITKVPTYTYGSKENNSIYYCSEYTLEHQYYGIPDWFGASQWIDIEYRIPKYNIDKLDNGFHVGAIVDLFGTEPPNGMTAQEYVEKIKDSFTGEGNNSKILFQMLDSQEQKSSVQILDNIREGDFQKLHNLAVQNIITAHRFTPSLAGIQVAGKLGSLQQIQTEFEIIHGTVIQPYKDKILRVLNQLIKEAGFDITLGVETPSPVSVASAIIPNEVLTINEQRLLLGMQPIEGADVLLTKQTI
tara:strand:- start:650 stop:1924 length:1275 start_codon:yes stop_codon:yes gene_type:complete